MKKKILIVVKEYYPIPSPSANLIIPLLNEIKLECEVKILVRKSNINLKNREFIDGVEILRIKDNFAILDSILVNIINNSKNKISKKILNIIYILKRIFLFLCRKVNIYGYSNFMVKKIEKNIKEIVIENNIDYIIPITFEEIIAAVKYKKNAEKGVLIPYILEQFLSEEKDSIYAKCKLKKLKLDLIEYSKKVFVLPALNNYFENKNKVIVTEHPMIVDNTQKAFNGDKIKLTYAGGLDQKQRNPKGVLEILDKINKKKDFKIDFYSYGNCSLMLSNFQEKSEKYFTNNNAVSSEIAHSILKNSDILITIGNVSNRVVPSKIFDCISTGKPIVHFYFHESDPYINYLDRYKLALCIKLDNKNISEKSILVERFCRENKGVNRDYRDFSREFIECTPKYVARQFLLEIQ